MYTSQTGSCFVLDHLEPDIRTLGKVKLEQIDGGLEPESFEMAMTTVIPSAMETLCHMCYKKRL